jgi:COP9 signalosome complex subunit 6
MASPSPSTPTAPANPLMSAQKTSDLHAALHPLVVLNISDYITRHTLRAQRGPLVGGIIGQQNGREITVEHAFDAHLFEDASVEGGWRLDVDWFSRRLDQSGFLMTLVIVPRC